MDILKKGIAGIAVIIFFLSCTGESKKGELVEKDTMYQLKERGWTSRSMTRLYEGLSYKATQVPVPFYLAKQFPEKDLREIDSIYQTVKTERIVEINFEQEKGKDLLEETFTRMDYESGVKYMAFEIQKDFKAITQSGDSIRCSGVTFERNFKLAPYKKVLLYFEGVPEGESIEILYEDLLFGNGLIRFQFTDPPIAL
ncbi:hypothetical protein ACFSTE_13375 [Aquimarina hainanensis]|uniref:Lipoprotein n=1 Tax=Aquimarina hainanensis TaxID=1578017 RepID=A0ABW5N9U5_9FLAO|nr:hypothetical protein [Aquimarina sp. TRL1]QKX04208.1 hypothetical protein HN014_04550 [Aquimarina sp. TRL1]